MINWQYFSVLLIGIYFAAKFSLHHYANIITFMFKGHSINCNRGALNYWTKITKLNRCGPTRNFLSIYRYLLFLCHTILAKVFKKLADVLVYSLLDVGS